LTTEKKKSVNYLNSSIISEEYQAQTQQPYVEESKTEVPSAVANEFGEVALQEKAYTPAIFEDDNFDF
jgi:sorting nexin-1/2